MVGLNIGSKRSMDSSLSDIGGKLRKAMKTSSKDIVLKHMEDHKEDIPALAYVCSSGMLAKVQCELELEFLLPESNQYVNNICRSFLGHALCMFEPELITVDVLEKLIESDADAVYKLFSFATSFQKKTQVPTRHRASCLQLWAELYKKQGRRLAKMNWKKIATSGEVDWQQDGVYRLELDEEGKMIIGVRHMFLKKEVTLKRPCPSDWILAENHSELQANIIDTTDGSEEDPIDIAKKFMSSGVEFQPVVFNEAQIRAAKRECEAPDGCDAVWEEKKQKKNRGKGKGPGKGNAPVAKQKAKGKESLAVAPLKAPPRKGRGAAAKSKAAR